MPVLRYPARAVAAAFALTIAAGTLLLASPMASASGSRTDLVTALFTATSAVCVTGLTVVDTAGYWSLFGELVVLGLVQVGGLGIMAAASLLGLLVARRVSLRVQVSAQTERKGLGLGAREVVAGVVRTSLLFEAVTALILTARLWGGYHEPFGQAVYLGTYHAVSAFNNAGFSLYADSLARFATDPWICLPIALAVLSGALGFPVLFELRRHLPAPKRGRQGRRRRWSLHAKITVLTSLLLLALGTIAVTAFEWGNAGTFGRFGVPGKLLAGFFQAAMRTSGLSTVDVGGMEPATLLSLDVLMFIGGGSGGVAGGIKVTTFALLGFVILAEARAEPHVHVLGRRLPADIQRQALSVALLSVGGVMTTTLILLVITPFDLGRVLFESVSAFGTVGFSTGITAEMPEVGKVIVALAMFAGRLGPVTLASALALRERARHYELPEERPIVG